MNTKTNAIAITAHQVMLEPRIYRIEEMGHIRTDSQILYAKAMVMAVVRTIPKVMPKGWRWGWG